jgi:Arc/MetJ-type ribon-helix-helix transcriptional regulator
MQIRLLRGQEATIAALAARTGRSMDDVVQEALARWAERETDLAEFRETLDEAEASLARGEGIEISEESMRHLAEDVNRRGRQRLAAKEGDV